MKKSKENTPQMSIGDHALLHGGTLKGTFLGEDGYRWLRFSTQLGIKTVQPWEVKWLTTKAAKADPLDIYKEMPPGF